MREAIVSALRASALGAALFCSGGIQMIEAAAPQVHEVRIEGMKFVPETVKVRVGDTIVWKNQDIFPHTATAVAPGKAKPRFDSGLIASGKEFRLRIRSAQPKDSAYLCAYHPTMRGRILVIKTSE